MNERRKVMTIERAESLETGTLGDCACADASASSLNGVGAPKKEKRRYDPERRTRRGQTRLQNGPHCVVSAKTGKVFGCYRDRSTADRVAAGMKNGLFRVETRKK